MRFTIGRALSPAWWIIWLEQVLLNPTKSFPERRVMTLTLNVPARTLSDVEFGSHLHGLESFGRADHYTRWGSEGFELSYYDLGLKLSLLQGKFDGFSVYLSTTQTEYHKIHAFRDATLELRLARGTPLSLSTFSTEMDLLARFYTLLDTDIVAGRSWCLFVVDGIEINTFSHAETRQLLELEVQAE